MTTLETSKPQFTFTQFGATGKWGDERHRQETGDSRDWGRGVSNGRIVAWWWHAHLQFFYDVYVFGLARLGLAWLGSGSHSCQAEGEAEHERERGRETEGGSGSDLGSKMSGWQKCLNAITNLTFHITSKRQSLSQVNSSPSPSQSCERSPTYAPC